MRHSSFILSLLTATFYFLLTVLVQYSEAAKGLFTTLMLFLPGLTFPLASTNLYAKFSDRKPMLLILHCFFSFLIYHGAVWVYSAEREFFLMPFIGGVAGSLVYSLITVSLLKAPLRKAQIIAAALVSGLVFIPYLVFQNMTTLGVALFCWTMTNWFIMEREQTTANIAFLQ